MKKLVIILTLLCFSSGVKAINTTTLNFDSSLSVNVVGDQIPDDDVTRAMKYAERLYLEKESSKVNKLCMLLLAHYNGKMTPEINYLNSKSLFMMERYNDFFESYKKNYILFQNSNLVKSNEYTTTLEKAINFALKKRYNSIESDYAHVKTLIECYALLNEISKKEHTDIRKSILDRMNVTYTYNDSVKLDNGLIVGTFIGGRPDYLGKITDGIGDINRQVNNFSVILALSDFMRKIHKNFNSNLQSETMSMSADVPFKYEYSYRAAGAKPWSGTKDYPWLKGIADSKLSFRLSKNVPIKITVDLARMVASNTYLNIEVLESPRTDIYNKENSSYLIFPKYSDPTIIKYKITLSSLVPILEGEKNSVFDWPASSNNKPADLL